MIFTMNLKDKIKNVVTESGIEPATRRQFDLRAAALTSRPWRQLSAGAVDVDHNSEFRLILLFSGEVTWNLSWSHGFRKK